MKRIVTAAAIAITTAPAAHAFPVVGGNGLTPAAWALANYIRDSYPGVLSIGGVRADPIADHPTGHAIDIMIPSLDYGDMIYADLSSHMAAHSIKYLLYRQPSHWDHIHATVF